MILTNGGIQDVEETIDEIVKGSSLPLSIIIVGLGQEDFSSMIRLDGDTEALYSQRYNKYVDNDMVQFVPYRKFSNDPMLLAQETLKEVPEQFLKYMAKKGIIPNSANFEQRIINQEEEKKQDQNQTQPPFYAQRKA